MISHVELRPMADFSDYCMITPLNDADYFSVYAASPGEPASRQEVFDNADEAIRFLFASERYKNVRKWYNGNETMQETASIDEIFLALHEYYEDELDELVSLLGISSAHAATLIATATEA